MMVSFCVTGPPPGVPPMMFRPPPLRGGPPGAPPRMLPPGPPPGRPQGLPPGPPPGLPPNLQRMPPAPPGNFFYSFECLSLIESKAEIINDVTIRSQLSSSFKCICLVSANAWIFHTKKLIHESWLLH